jgi:hypothetical protein
MSYTVDQPKYCSECDRAKDSFCEDCEQEEPEQEEPDVALMTDHSVCEGCGADFNEYEECTCPEHIEQSEPDPITPPSPFTVDFRKTSPALHLFHVKDAVEKLAMVRKTIRKFYNCATIHMSTFASILREECQELIRTDAAWAEAQEILNSLNIHSLEG